MRQSSYEILGEQKKIRLIAGDHFISLPKKFRKGDWTAILNSNNGIVPAGTLTTVDGKPVITTESTTDAWGIIYQDINFNGSMSIDGNDANATENGSVFIHGAVYESAVSLDATNKEIEKAALKQIIFGE